MARAAALPAARKPRRAGARSRFDWPRFLILCGLFVAVALLWHTEWVLPLKLFVVLLHETSHGLAAVLTGGRITELQVFGDQGGHCMTSGGWRFFIASAGYLGSLGFGALLLLVSTRTRFAPHVGAVVGALVAVIALRYMPGWTFGKGFAVIAGVVLALLALVPQVASETVLRIVGITSCLYAILDIKHDILDRDHPASDAAALEAITGIPAFGWGLLWITLSVAITAWTAKTAISGPRPGAAPGEKGAKSKASKATASKAKGSKKPAKRKSAPSGRTASSRA